MTASSRERAIAALASGLILLALVAALVIGLAPPALHAPRVQDLVAFAMPPPDEPRVSRAPRHVPQDHAGGGASPPAPKLDLPAATPAQPLPAPPLVIVPLPLPAGADGAAGTAIGGGAGNGSGGTGAGTGSGSGNGTGPGAGPAVRARQTHGHLSPGDLPDGILQPGASAGVTVRYVVGVDGRVGGCTVIGTSGLPQVDAVPCPLIEARFRFRPARDARGQPVPDTIEETHTWFEPERR